MTDEHNSILPTDDEKAVVKKEAKDIFRMTHWLLISLVLYVVAGTLAAYETQPQMQTVLWKVGHIVVAAFVGYRIDRATFRDRITAQTSELIHIRRAIIMGCAMLAIALGM